MSDVTWLTSEQMAGAVTFGALVAEVATADRAHATASAALDAAHAAVYGTRAKAYEARCALNEYVAARITAAGGAESL